MYVQMDPSIQMLKGSLQTTRAYKQGPVKMKEADWAMLESKLSQWGFENPNQLCHAIVAGRFPKQERSEQVEKLLDRIRDKGIKDPLSDVVSSTFYKSADLQNFKSYLYNRYEIERSARTIFNYYKRYVDIFFTKPILLKDSSGHVRSYICDAMRRFAEWYDQRYGDAEVRLLIDEIIKRYDLNKRLRIHDRLWIGDSEDLKERIKTVLNIQSNEFDILIKFALFSGLRGTEIEYCHQTPLCKNLTNCVCTNLHVKDKRNGFSVIVVNRRFGQKYCYFTIVPTRIWEQFRELNTVDYDRRKACHTLLAALTDKQVAFMDLRKYHYNVNYRSPMKEQGAEILAGRARSTSARHYLLNMIDEMVDHYQQGWLTYGVDFFKLV
jgi:intergrase/recombinase